MSTSTASSSGKSSVFDRLYSKGTASSKVRKSVAPVKEKNFLNCHEDGKAKNSSSTRPMTNKPHSVTKPVRKTTASSNGAVYDRLYSKGTASYNTKKKGTTAGGQPSREVDDPRGPLKTKTNA